MNNKEGMLRKISVFFIFSIIIIFQYLLPCTIFNAFKEGRVLVGNNEDWFTTDTKIWFIPPSKGKYGVVYVGFVKFGKQGGMNDQGLFYDFNALKYSRMKPQPEKPSFAKDQNPMELIMTTCATVEEVIQLLEKYNLGGWNNCQLQLVDKTGASVVLGANKEGNLAITRKQGDYQVSTNFNLANPEYGAYHYPCHRYEIAEKMLKEMKKLSIDYFRSILDAVHNEGRTPTIYSNICDLTNGDIYLYNFHNFEEVVKFHLADELKKGAHSYNISSLFSRKTYAQIKFEEEQKKQVSAVILRIIKKKGLQSAIDNFYKIKDKYSTIPSQLKKVAEELAREGKINEAINICELATETFPSSSEAYENLGDAYTATGNLEKAIKSYKKSRELNPKNKIVKYKLKELEDKVNRK